MKTPQILSKNDLQRHTPVYYFQKGIRPSWEHGYIRKAEDHIVLISSRRDHGGKPINAAYEDIILVPSSPLLQDIVISDSLFPSSHSLIEDVPLDNDGATTQTESEVDDIFPPPRVIQPNSPTPQPDISPPQLEGLDSEQNEIQPQPNTNEDENTIQAFVDSEQRQCNDHPSTPSLLTRQRPTRVQLPFLDIDRASIDGCNSMFGSQYNTDPPIPDYTINSAHNPARPEKDIGSTDLVTTPNPSCQLESSEQQLLKKNPHGCWT